LLNRPRFKACRPGLSRMFLPELPNRPFGGAPKAEASNQRSIVRWLVGRLPLPIRSGIPPIVCVLEGSEPANVGVMNSPVCALYVALISQPPNIQLLGPPWFIQRRPMPAGISQISAVTSRWRGLYCASARSRRRLKASSSVGPPSVIPTSSVSVIVFAQVHATSNDRPLRKRLLTCVESAW